MNTKHQTSSEKPNGEHDDAEIAPDSKLQDATLKDSAANSGEHERAGKLPAKATREARLGEALRANLRRRKQLSTRSGSAGPGETSNG